MFGLCSAYVRLNNNGTKVQKIIGIYKFICIYFSKKHLNTKGRSAPQVVDSTAGTAPVGQTRTVPQVKKPKTQKGVQHRR